MDSAPNCEIERNLAPCQSDHHRNQCQDLSSLARQPARYIRAWARLAQFDAHSALAPMPNKANGLTLYHLASDIGVFDATILCLVKLKGNYSEMKE